MQKTAKYVLGANTANERLRVANVRAQWPLEFVHCDSAGPERKDNSKRGIQESVVFYR